LQREKHYRCPECAKKLNTAKSLSVHSLNVHKRALTAVPSALAGRADPLWDIFGMAGVPSGMKPGEQPPHKPGQKAEDAAPTAASAGMQGGMVGGPGMGRVGMPMSGAPQQMMGAQPGAHGYPGMHGGYP
jgi:hypothetical protein